MCVNARSCFSISLMVSVVLIVLSGCVAFQPFPNVFRAGDTITLAVGSADGMTKDNIEVRLFYKMTIEEVIDYDTAPYTDLTSNVVEVFKLYPDKTSKAWLSSDAVATSVRSGHGSWLSIIAINLPSTLSDGIGVIKVITDPGIDYPHYNPLVDDIDISVTILPDPDGAPNPLDYAIAGGNPAAGDLSKLKMLSQIVVRPPKPSQDEVFDVYGGIEVKVTAPMTDLLGGQVLDEGLRVIMDPQPDHEASQLSRSWARTGNDFTVYMVSPVGMKYHEARFSIVPLFPDYLYLFSGPPNIQSIKYYDLNGDEVTGPLGFVATKEGSNQ